MFSITMPNKCSDHTVTATLIPHLMVVGSGVIAVGTSSFFWSGFGLGCCS